MIRIAKKPPISEVSNFIDDVQNFGLDIYSRQIFLNGHLSDVNEGDPGIDYRSISGLIKNLHILESFGRSKIIINMNLDGGDWPYCLGGFDAIKACKSYVVMVAYSHATSSSSILFQAADKRIMMPNSYLMTHHGSIGIDSTSQAVSEAVKFNDNECQRMLNIFAERAVEGPFFKSKRWGVKKIVEYIDAEMRRRGDWYLTSEQAVDFGFADGILGVDGCKV